MGADCLVTQPLEHSAHFCAPLPQVVGQLDLDVNIGPPDSLTIGGVSIPIPLPSFDFNILIQGGYSKTFGGTPKNGSWAPSGATPSTLNTAFLDNSMVPKFCIVVLFWVLGKSQTNHNASAFREPGAEHCSHGFPIARDYIALIIREEIAHISHRAQQF
jgi:hypothetical protein